MASRYILINYLRNRESFKVFFFTFKFCKRKELFLFEERIVFKENKVQIDMNASGRLCPAQFF